MTTILITFFVMLLVTGLMAIGVILGRKPIAGSCGGLGKIMGNKCAFCEKKDKCQKA